MRLYVTLRTANFDKYSFSSGPRLQIYMQPEMPKVVHVYKFEGLSGLDSFVFSHAPGRVSTCCRCVLEVTR